MVKVEHGSGLHFKYDAWGWLAGIWTDDAGLPADVVAELQVYLANRGDLSLNEKLFSTLPTIRVFDADIQAAGIPKKDARGWIVDIYALRHTFGTHLSAAGVHPRTVMAAMHHSRIELTMNYYTDPVLLDVAGAVEALPSFARVGSSDG